MGVPKGLLQAANPGKLKPMTGRRIGPAGPGTTSPGKRKLGGGFHKSSTSAFGVDHGEFSKKQEPSGGRKFLASAAPIPHGLIAGKKGKKVRSAANQGLGGAGGAFAGNLIGAGLGAAATRGRSMTGAHVGGMAGAVTGGVAGSQAGLRRNTRKGYLKKET